MIRKNSNLLLVSAIAVTLIGCKSIPIAEDAAALEVAFQWSKHSGCSPTSPKIEIANLPANTHYLNVQMQDLDKLSYNHGGGEVIYNGQGYIEEGGLQNYKGPCPPAGAHRYKFTVKALNESKNLILGQGTHTKKYPG